MESMYGKRHPEALRKEGQLAVGFILLVLSLALPYAMSLLTGALDLSLGSLVYQSSEILFCIIGVAGLFVGAASLQNTGLKVGLMLAGGLWLFVQLIVTVINLIR